MNKLPLVVAGLLIATLVATTGCLQQGETGEHLPLITEPEETPNYILKLTDVHGEKTEGWYVVRNTDTGYTKQEIEESEDKKNYDNKIKLHLEEGQKKHIYVWTEKCEGQWFEVELPEGKEEMTNEEVLTECTFKR